MSYKRQWLLKDRVCYINFSENVTLEDVTGVSHAHHDWLAQTNSSVPVHYLVDTQNMLTYPRNIFAINQALAGNLMQTGWMVFITADFFVTYVGDIFAKKLGFNVKAVKTVLDGYSFLQQVDDIPEPQSWINSNDTMPIHQAF